MFKFNHFSKKPDSKTGFLLMHGEAIFSQTVYLLEPKYIHKRSPAFSLVSQRGKHVSGLFAGCNGWLVGDYQKKGLLVHISPEGLAFDLFLSDQPPTVLKQRLCSGELNDELFKARQSA